jgi:hypothetical protein
MSSGEDPKVTRFPRPLPGAPKYTLDPEDANSDKEPIGDGGSWTSDRWPVPPDTRVPPTTSAGPAASLLQPASTAQTQNGQSKSAQTSDDYDPYGPLPPRPERAEEQRAPGAGAPCNYIFAVGRPGSGKSTFQSHLFRYLLTAGDHVVEPDVDFVRTSPAYRKLRAEWQEQWDRGQFPTRTLAKRVTEFRYVVKPNSGLPAIPFGFLEISGEDFVVLSQPSEALPTLLPSLDQFLNNPKVTVAFLFVCQGQDMKGDDFLFSQFLEYLAAHTTRPYKNHSSVALILADPDSCQRRLAKKLKLPDDGRVLDIAAFVDHFTPMTAGLLADWKQRATIATFSVGTIRDRVIDGKPIPFIADPSFEDTRAIFDWLYEQFTGRSAGPGFWEKTKRWLQQLGGGK